MDWLTIDPSELRHSGQIQAQSSTHGTSGEVINTWSTVATRRCSVAMATHTEKATADSLTTQCTHVICMRWGVTVAPGNRVVIAADTYTVQAVENVQQRNIKLKLYVLTIGQDSN